MLLQGSSARPATLRKQPFHVTRSLQGAATTTASITLHLVPGLDISQHTERHAIVVGLSSIEETHCQTYHFTTQEHDYMPQTSMKASPAGLDTATEHAADLEPSCKRLKV